MVEAQQAAATQPAMRQQRSGATAWAAPDGAAAASPAASARPHIAQLQRLVQDMRAELQQPPAAPAAAAAEPSTGQYDTSWDAGSQQGQRVQQHQLEQERQVAALSGELADTRARLQRLQQAHDAVLAQQVGLGSRLWCLPLWWHWT